jgi:hypothetical protein
MNTTAAFAALGAANAAPDNQKWGDAGESVGGRGLAPWLLYL